MVKNLKMTISLGSARKGSSVLSAFGMFSAEALLTILDT
jgi:hypothetical protein